MVDQPYIVRSLKPPLGRFNEVLNRLLDETSNDYDPDLAARIYLDLAGFQPSARSRLRERSVADPDGIDIHVLPPPTATTGNTRYLIALIVNHRGRMAYAYDGRVFPKDTGSRLRRFQFLLKQRTRMEDYGNELIDKYSGRF